MTLHRAFNLACALVMAVSIYSFAFGAPRTVDSTDPRERLLAFLTSQGLALESSRPLHAGEELLVLRRADCPQPIGLLYLPTIHRISDAARVLASRDHAQYVHDRKAVPSLGALTLIPRWLWTRLLINFQLKDETPWPSVALAVLPPEACSPVELPWEMLR